MAHFFGSITGAAQGAATRSGTKESGIYSHTRGWNIGASVELKHMESLGEDICYVAITGGSHNPTTTKNLCSAKRDERGDLKLFLEPDLLLACSDENWEALLRYEAVAKRLRALLFVHMDKAQ